VPNFEGSLSDEHFTTSIDLILHFLPNFAFFCLVPIVANLHAKVEVFIYNRYRDREGSQILKVGHVTTSRALWP